MRLASSWVFVVASSLFVLGIVVQVYLVGLAVVSGRIGFDLHVALGHALALPVLVMVVAAYLARAPRRTVWLAWALLVVYALQADVLIFLRGSAPYLAAFHPVLALADVVLGLLLVRAGWALLVHARSVRPMPAGPAAAA